jgi:hypothetical protein
MSWRLQTTAIKIFLSTGSKLERGAGVIFENLDMIT